MRSHYPIRRLIIAVLCIVTCASAASAQIRRSTVTKARLPEPPRELRRVLERAEKSIADQRYSDAVILLNQLLESSEDEQLNFPAEDYFLGAADKPLVDQSFKRKAIQLMGDMPAAGREIVELQLGRDAQRQLERGLKTNDLNQLREVSRRFFHTQAGYEATYLLGRYHLDRMRPLAAALQFRRLIETDNARKFQPEVNLLYAAALAAADQNDAALAALEQLRNDFPSAKFELAGKEVAIPRSGNLIAWLQDTIGHINLLPTVGVEDWKMARGAPDRNAFPDGGMPLSTLDFAVNTTAFESEAFAVANVAKTAREQSRYPLPVMEPLVVGSHLVMRTPKLIYGVELETGNRIWPFPYSRAEPDQLEAMTQPAGTSFLTQRIFYDRTYGKMSSDGRAVFAVIDPSIESTSSQPSAPNQAMQWRMGGMTPRRSNQLAAIDLASEGKSLWIVGGAESDEPKLQDVYFLGAPLPIDGQLCAIAEWRDEVKLLILDANDGSLLWSQQLAEFSPTMMVYGGRPNSGCSPSYSDGILICPTAVGAIVAVDFGTRTLLWAHRFSPERSTRSNHLQMQMQMRRASQSGYANQWVDNIPIISNGYVVHTSPTSNRLHCLDLLTGESKWRPSKRSIELYVAGVVNDMIITATYGGARAIDIETGKIAWNFVLEDDAKTSGRGFISDDALFLPTTNREVVKINLADGKATERVRTQFVLGNLVCHGDKVISQNYDAVRVFRLRDQTREQVKKRLAENPDDIDALEDQVGILLGDDKRAEALETLRRLTKLLAASDAEDESAAIQLQSLRDRQLALMLDLLQDDFASNEALIEEAQPLLRDDSSRERFLLMLAEHHFRKQNLEPAFQSFCDLLQTLAANGTSSDSDMVEGELDADRLIPSSEQGWLMGRERRIGMRLTAILEQADEALEKKLRELLSSRIREAIEAEDTDLMGAWERTMPNAAPIDALRLAHAKKSATAGRYLDADLALLGLDDSSEALPDALAQRAEMLSRHGSDECASYAFRQLIEKAAGKTLRDGRSVDDIIREQTDRIGEAGHPGRWSEGEIRVSDEPTTQPESSANSLRYMMTRESKGGWPESYRVTFDMTSNSLTVYDGLGAIVTRVDFNVKKYGYGLTGHPNQQIVRAYGNLLVLSLGTKIVALDMISEVANPDDRILWTSDRRSTAAPQAVNIGSATRFNAKTSKIPFANEGVVVATIGENRMGQLGPVGKYGVCYIDEGDLYCVDSLTGQPYWVRKDVGKKSEVFGDDEYVFVADATKREAKVYSTRSGELIGTRKTPKPERRWRNFGRFVLTYDTLLNQPFRVRLFDVWEEKDVWSYEFPFGTKGTMVGNDTVAMFSEAGDFTVIRLRDGEKVVEQNIAGDFDDLTQITVTRSADDYLLLIHLKNDRKMQRDFRDNRTQTFNPPIAGPAPKIITGFAHCFDRKTGEPRWPGPIEINEFGLAPYTPADVPVVAFIRNVHVKTARQEKFSSIICLDRRTGELLYADYRRPTILQTFRMRGDVDEQMVNIQTGTRANNPQTQFALQFTDEPRKQVRIDSLAPVKQKIDSKEEKSGSAKARLENLFGGDD